ncbi:MAG TPA: nitrilase-related carbon-nitrogen hydrolase [Chitinophagaceae bacterium]
MSKQNITTIMPTKVAVCQVPDIREDIKASLKWIEKFVNDAEKKEVSLIGFPECFLQGYLTEKISAQKYAINLQSKVFANTSASIGKI